MSEENSTGDGNEETSKGLEADWRTEIASGLDAEGQTKWNNLYGKMESKTAFAKSVLDMQADFNRRIPVPKFDEDPDGLKSFSEKYLGVPSDPKNYQFTHAEGIEYSQEENELKENFRSVAKELNLSQRQLDGLVKWNDANRTLATDAWNDANNAFVDNTRSWMQKEYGPDVSKVLDQLPSVQRALLGENYGDFADLRLEGGGHVGDHPMYIKMMNKLSSSVLEDNRLNDLQSSGKAQGIQDQIEAKQREMIKEGISPYSQEWAKNLKDLRSQIGNHTPISPLSGTKALTR